MIFVYLFIIGIPAVLVFITIKKMLAIKNIEQNGITTNGVITKIVLTRINKSRFEKVLLQYRDNHGNDHVAKATVMPGKFKRGETVPIIYLEQKPSAYSIKGMQQGQWFGLIFLILILAFMIFASFKLQEMVETGQY